MDTAGRPAAGATGVVSPQQIWVRVFEQVRRDVDVATVWLAMEAVTPLTVDGHYFVAALPPDRKYLAINLQSAEYSTTIEEALRDVTGRVLAFHLIQGETLADWQAEKAANPARFQPARSATAPPPPPPANSLPPPPAHTASSPAHTPPPAPRAAPASTRQVSPTWEILYERLNQRHRAAPLLKYAHGQARYLLESVQAISDTMDLLMPGPGQPSDDAQEKALSRVIEKFGSIINLDPLFISLELLRYRQAHGKDVGVPE